MSGYYGSQYWQIQRDRALMGIIIAVVVIGIFFYLTRKYPSDSPVGYIGLLVPIPWLLVSGVSFFYSRRRLRQALRQEQDA
jgi:hypothetical protein